MSRKFMVSFDVVSLFTKECIDLAVNYISVSNPDIKLNLSELRLSLFTTATGQIHFIFSHGVSPCSRLS